MLTTIFLLRIVKDYLATNRQSMFKARAELISLCKIFHKTHVKFGPRSGHFHSGKKAAVCGEEIRDEMGGWVGGCALEIVCFWSHCDRRPILPSLLLRHVGRYFARYVCFKTA